MLTRLLPEDRHLRRAVAGLLAFVILSIAAGALAGWEGFCEGKFGRDGEDLAQIVWHYGLNSPEAATAIEQLGTGSRSRELVALVDPTTGKATAAWPGKYTGKPLGDMVLDSGVKLPGLQMVQEYRSLHLRRFAQGQTAVLTDPISRLKAQIDGGGWVKVRVSALYPWRTGSTRVLRRRPLAALALTAATPTGLSLEATAAPDGDFDEGRGERTGFSGSAQPLGYFLVVNAPPTLTPLAISASLIGGAAALALLLYWLSVAWWVFLDARRRGNSPFAWGMLALLTNLVGVAIYLIVRRQWLQCPDCSGTVDKKFRHCPWCGRTLGAICAQCNQPLHRGWVHCANCGTAAP